MTRLEDYTAFKSLGSLERTLRHNKTDMETVGTLRGAKVKLQVSGEHGRLKTIYISKNKLFEIASKLIEFEQHKNDRNETFKNHGRISGSEFKKLNKEFNRAKSYVIERLNNYETAEPSFEGKKAGIYKGMNKIRKHVDNSLFKLKHKKTRTDFLK